MRDLESRVCVCVCVCVCVLGVGVECFVHTLLAGAGAKFCDPSLHTHGHTDMNIHESLVSSHVLREHNEQRLITATN